MIFVDFESRSRCNLKVCGGARYARDPSTEVLCLVAVDEAGRVLIWSPHKGPLGDLGQPRGLGDAEVWEEVGVDAPTCDWFWQAASEGPICAHNAEGFDRWVWLAAGLPEPRRGWIDSANLARRASLPGSLEGMSQRLFGTGKDAEGSKVMQALCQPHAVSHGAVDAVLKLLRQWRRGASEPAPPLLRWLAAPLGEAAVEAVRRGAWHASLQPLLDAPPYGVEVFRDPDPAQLTALVRYCLQDTALMRAAVLEQRWLEPHVDDPALAADVTINRRGMAVDLELVDQLLRAADEVTRQAGLDAALATNGEVTEATLRSRELLLAWLKEQGVVLPNVKADTVEAVLEGGAALPGHVAAVLRCRLAVARVARGKLAAIRARAVDVDGTPRLVNMLGYYGAHTGRWAGRGVQPQNLPRPGKAATPELADAVAAGQWRVQ